MRETVLFETQARISHWIRMLVALREACDYRQDSLFSTLQERLLALVQKLLTNINIYPKKFTGGSCPSSRVQKIVKKDTPSFPKNLTQVYYPPCAVNSS